MNIIFTINGYRKNTASNFSLQVLKNGVAIGSLTKALNSNPSTSTFPYIWSGNVSESMATGDYLEWVVLTDNSADPSYTIDMRVSSMTLTTDNPTITDVLYGTSVVMNDAIPKNIKQIDFFTSIIKLFNLYVWEDNVSTNKLYIEPYVNYYSEDPTNANDWTLKVDRSKPLVIKPMSELNSKVYNFKFKADSDYYNDLYQKKYSRGYGDYVFDSTYEFAQDESAFELLFSATPLVGYGGEEKVYPTIVKITDSVEETTDSNIRILQTKRVTGVASWDITGGTGTSSNTEYGYGGHFNDPDAPSNDLNFGVPDELFFVLASGDLSATQFNVYWSTYMAEITDKDARLMTCYVYLTPADIVNLDFSKYVDVDGVIFRLIKIYDWNASNPAVCKVDLLRVLQTVY